jgi:hypothetical protein
VKKYVCSVSRVRPFSWAECLKSFIEMLEVVSVLS